jgi:hypothetical protein
MSGSRLDHALAFSPIDISSLSLPVFPDLPEVHRVSAQIDAFCDTLYRDQRKAVRERMSALARQIRERLHRC